MRGEKNAGHSLRQLLYRLRKDFNVTLDGDGDEVLLPASRVRDDYSALFAPAAALREDIAPAPGGFLPGYAPKFIAHGPDNRTALVRDLHGRFEWRLPDASANPYLMLAGMVAAGLDGIEHELDPGPDVDVDLLETSPQELAGLGLRSLPHSLAQALDALEADEVLVNTLSPALVKEFVRLKRLEWAEYTRHVSAWELERYVDAF